jgi:hypothetical protein
LAANLNVTRPARRTDDAAGPVERGKGGFRRRADRLERDLSDVFSFQIRACDEGAADTFGLKIGDGWRRQFHTQSSVQMRINPPCFIGQILDRLVG